MPQFVPVELFWGSISIIIAMTVYVWNGLHGRIRDVEHSHKAFPISSIQSDIAAIKNDITWLKQFLIKK